MPDFLKLIVRPSGYKSFCYRAKLNGKDLKRKIGDVSTMSVATARLVADHQHSGIKSSDGLDLVASNNLQYFTVNHMFELYRENELSLRKTVAGRKHALEVAYNFHVKAELGYRIVKELEKKKFVRFFEGLEGKGYSAQNKAVSVLKAACNYVINFEETGLLVNPFDRVK